MMLWLSVSLLAILWILSYKYVTRNFDYWKKRNVFFFPPLPYFGNIIETATFKCNVGETLWNMYKKTDKPYFGIFTLDKPALVIRSPEIIKYVLLKDFSNFKDRTFCVAEHEKIYSYSMFFMKDSAGWTKIRKKLTPVFTTGKLKAMFPHIDNISNDMTKFINMKDNGIIDAKDVFAKYSTDVIAKCAFGINSQSFGSENAEFRNAGKRIFDFSWRNAISQTSHVFFPTMVRVFHLHFFDLKLMDFLSCVFQSTITKRESTNHKGNDMVDYLIDMKKGDTLGEYVPEILLAQAVQFFTAGFETTSTTIAFTVYELCMNPHIQTILREEVQNTIEKHGGITYDGIINMKYLDLCVCETLRKYPVLPFLDRTCDADYKIPGSDLVIEKGTFIYIPILGLHNDEQYFPNPEKYDPQRFSDKHKLNENGLYYLPFGEGPRKCIGARFGLLGAKIALVHIVSQFELIRTTKTPDTINFEPKSFLIQSTTAISVRMRRLNSR